MTTRVMWYCQHVLGMGHLIRSLEIVRALSRVCEVSFINGGEPIDSLPLDPAIQMINLEPIQSDAEFRELTNTDRSRTFEDIQQARRTKLQMEWERIQPQVFITELFPFGRLRFAFELLPLLARNRLRGNPTRVICSLRDILVGKADAVGHEAWVCSLINRYYDMLLVHADPRFQKLEETFSRVKDLQCSIHYTGFVAQSSDGDDQPSTEEMPLSGSSDPLILVSIGGGRVGFELIESAIQASLILKANYPHRMLIFTGPYMPPDNFSTLADLARQGPHIALRRFTNRFPSWVKAATLSISMAGYNTCMNIVTTGTPALMLPFTGRGNEEQTIRATKLQSLGLVTMLSRQDLEPARMAMRIVEALRTPAPAPSPTLDVSGAATTTQLIHSFTSQMETMATSPTVQTHPTTSWQYILQDHLEKLAASGKHLHIFLRDDDIDSDEDTLRSLTDITLSHGVPLNLEVIPGLLTTPTIRFLKHLKRIDPLLIEFNQHGWQHLNHEREGRKCEFGPNRTLDQQREDIARGKAILDEAFPLKWVPVFTPPWNRCTPDTYKVLDELGFLALSKDQGKEPVTGYGFREISTTLDLYRWKHGAVMKAPDEIGNELSRQMLNQTVIGLLLHHKVMDDTAFAFFDDLIRILRQSSHIHFFSFQGLLESY